VYLNQKRSNTRGVAPCWYPPRRWRDRGNSVSRWRKWQKSFHEGVSIDLGKN
jgi:hypothetical protein